QPGEHDPRADGGPRLPRERIEVGLDLDDGGNRELGLAEELEADGAHAGRHAMQHPARGGDDAVAASLLDTGQAGEELVGDVLAQARAPEGPARDRQDLAPGGLALHPAVAPELAGLEPGQLEARLLDVVDLAEVVP